MAIDLLLVNPGNRSQIYQNLGEDYSAIEPPFWIAVIAAFLRKHNKSVEIIDLNAQTLTDEEFVDQVKYLNPALASVIVYGSNPSASTQTMPAARHACELLKEAGCYVALGGLHPSALPEKTLREEDVDFVIDGEGPYTLLGLLEMGKNFTNRLNQIPGLWWKIDGVIYHSLRSPIIKVLDNILPIAAWDLLPMKNYRAHNWHCFDDIENRQPYGAIYTSLGCPYSCTFCCINTPFGKPTIRYRDPKIVIEEIDLLVNKYGVKNLKIIDELFILKEDHYMKIVDLIIERGYDLNIWAYARTDSIRFANLKKMKDAGINWLGLGIESASEKVLVGAKKKQKVEEMENLVNSLKQHEIRIGANFIFGLPGDTQETMKQTLDMALNLNAEMSNFYCAMAYPGSQLHSLMKPNVLPENHKDIGWIGYSQHAYETFPLSNSNLTNAEILKFRDDAFNTVYNDPNYLNMLENKFGTKVKQHILDLTKIKLKRKILE